MATAGGGRRSTALDGAVPAAGRRFSRSRPAGSGFSPWARRLVMVSECVVWRCGRCGWEGVGDGSCPGCDRSGAFWTDDGLMRPREAGSFEDGEVLARHEELGRLAGWIVFSCPGCGWVGRGAPTEVLPDGSWGSGRVCPGCSRLGVSEEGYVSADGLDVTAAAEVVRTRFRGRGGLRRGGC